MPSEWKWLEVSVGSAQNLLSSKLMREKYMRVGHSKKAGVMRQRQRCFFSFFPLFSILLIPTAPLMAEEHLEIDSNSLETIATLSSLPLHLNQIDETIVASMSLGGFAWIQEASPNQWQLTEKKDWPTLSFTPISDSLFLLGGRDGMMRFVEKGERGSNFLTLSNSQPSEGQFFAVDVQGGILAAASGGAGASFWEISEEQKTATLLGRYPFPAFARDIQWVNENHVILADAHDLGIVLLDISDPQNPREVSVSPLQRGFCDAFAFTDNLLLTHNRTSSVFLFQSPDHFQSIQYSDQVFLYDYIPTKEVLRISDIGYHDETFFILDQIQGLYTVAPPATGGDWKVTPVTKTVNALTTFTVDETRKRIFLGDANGEIMKLDYVIH